MTKMTNQWPEQDEILQPDESPESISDNPTMTLTVEDLMHEFHISRNTAYALTERKDFPIFRIGKRKLINREKLQEWMNRQTPDVA